MPVSTLAYVKEKARQSLNLDDLFYKKMFYFFELRIPAEVGYLGDTDFLFPLIIPPENYTMEEPFTVEATPTQGGGLYVEENGIVQRMIRLRGHTGFKPRTWNLPSSFGPVPATLPPEKKSHSRELNELAIGALSGQRHFHYLQDSVFRTYADLKRDPAMAKDTALIFHNPRDEEHWLVVPQRFTLERDNSNRVLYRYNIELLVVDKAEAREADFSEDKSLFDSLKDALRSIKKAIDMVTGAINDVTALVGEIKNFVKDITKIIDAVGDIIDAASNFVDGITELIELPYAFLESTIGLVDSATDAVNAVMELGETAQAFPETAMNKLRQIGDGLEQLGQNPANWETPTEATIRKLREKQEARRSWSEARKQEALESEAPTTFEEVRNRGTALTPGDVQSAEGELTIGSAIKKFKSARQITIDQGDTLVSLAAKYMGDGRLWQHIATMNGLKPPFVDAQASLPLVAAVSEGSDVTGTATGADVGPFDGASGVGSKILIPTNQKSALQMPILPVQGVKASESAEAQFLGSDFKMEVVADLYGSSRAQYDIAIDTDLGAQDAQAVQGMDNLGQMIMLRLLTEYGTDTLYKRVGLRRIVGTRFIDVDLVTARYRIQEAIGKDPRVAGVRQVVFNQPEGGEDQLHVDVTVLVRGFTEPRKVSVTL